MNPLSIGLGVVGLGMSLYGGMKSSEYAQEVAQENQMIAQDEMKINQQKKLQMELEARRGLVQNLRNAQRLRAQATAAATNQGASKGSGLYGGLAEVTGQEGVNALGINQNLEIGRTIFGLNDSISAHKQKISSIQGDMATSQAISGFGGTLMGISGPAGNILSGRGTSRSGDYTGNPWSLNTGNLY